LKPSAAYQKLQGELQALIQSGDRTGQTEKLRQELEKQFMAAWQLTPDRRGLSGLLRASIKTYRTLDGKPVLNFDHCTIYTGSGSQRILVTQPRDSFCSMLEHNLTLDSEIGPEISEATEWAFYSPGLAKLFLLKFPFLYVAALEKFALTTERGAVEESARQIRH